MTAPAVAEPRVPGFELGYRPALDGLRAVAITMVLCHHAVAVLTTRRDLPLGGFLGVDVFFVLSGFLITSLLLAERRLDRAAMGRFYLRRARRLLPAVIVYLVVHGVAAALLGRDPGQELRTSLAALLYVANWAETFGWDLAPDQVHLWSLSVEEQFYALWPPVLALALAWGRRGRRLVRVLAGAVLAIAAWRLVLVTLLGAGPQVFFRTDARADTILVGALLAAALHGGWRPSPRLCRVAGWSGSALIAYAFIEAAELMDLIYRGGFTVLAIGAAGVVLACLDGHWAPARLLARPMPVLVGRLSYSLYLWHLLCFGLVASLHQGPLPVRLALAIAASFACAGLSYRFVERPWLGRARPLAMARESAAPAADRLASAPRATWQRSMAGATAVGVLVLGVGVAGAAAVAATRDRHPVPPVELAEAGTGDPSPADDRSAPGAGGSGAPTGGSDRADRDEQTGAAGAVGPVDPLGEQGAGTRPDGGRSADEREESTLPERLPGDLADVVLLEVLVPALDPAPPMADVVLAARAVAPDGTGRVDLDLELVLRRPGVPDVACRTRTDPHGDGACRIVLPAGVATDVANWVVEVTGSSDGAVVASASWDGR